MFVVRTIKHSFLTRAGGLTYVAFFLAQVGGHPGRRALAHCPLGCPAGAPRGRGAVCRQGSALDRPLSRRAAQIASTLIGIFGFNGYEEPRDDVTPCQMCGLAYGTNT